ncbi:NUDIX hydrolase [Methanobacterium congolense]|jgi:8-oxo-dGTP diphosphatase|uniref:MutT-like protein n=1 Tax=Methanobacterium congolense TaxID=118062 RepID=A0A1D3L0X0_9EURY|nr:NUDIX domain-containing protein [Methanobacterium congolense]SCG85206.1 MutT-like protein [Methanobacterium congolense]
MINHIFGLAVRVILTDPDGKILIIKRSTESKTNPGRWELPGGKVDQNESIDQALLREVYEETGLKITPDHVVGVSEQNLHIIRAVHIIMSGRIIEGELTLSPEHEGYAWVFLENLSNYELADWLHDFITNQKSLIEDYKEHETETTDDAEEILKRGLKSLKKSLNNFIEKNDPRKPS